MEIFEVLEGDGEPGLIMGRREVMDCALRTPGDEARIILSLTDDVVEILVGGFDDACFVKGYRVR